MQYSAKRTLLLIGFMMLALSVYAESMIYVKDSGMWKLYPEEKQYCLISYQEGIQRMALTVMPERLGGTEAVWIFPVPAKPEAVTTKLIPSFPRFYGSDVLEKAKETINEAALLLSSSQIYPAVLYFRGTESVEGEADVYTGEIIYGVNAELVTLDNMESLLDYLQKRGIELDPKEALLSYIEKGYSFVVFWASGLDRNKGETNDGKGFGLTISFPTQKIYYPLKPTSAYGSREIHAVIYVVGYAQPEVYAEIENSTEVDYFEDGWISAVPELREFFLDYEPSYDREGSGPNETLMYLHGVRYTRIRIFAPTTSLKEDLWIMQGPPTRIKYINLFSSPALLLMTFLFTSCIASMLAGVLVYGKTSKKRFIILGLANLLTLPIFIWVAYWANNKRSERKRVGFTREARVMIYTGIVLLLTVFLSFYIRWKDHRITEIIPFLLPLFMFLLFAIFLLLPFEWCYNHDKKTMKFALLFSALFLAMVIFLMILAKLLL